MKGIRLICRDLNQILRGWGNYFRTGKAAKRILMEPKDFEYGEPHYNAEDYAGHQWTFSETIRDVAPEEWGGISVPEQPSAFTR